ncbi:MAG: helix-turn-helix domain-containing protein [Bacteroidales bacterium]|nr:helix-turn-helix domain-containing protein [Bacteroidales bacterium]
MTPTIPDVADTARFTAKEAADLLGVDRSTIHRWTRERRLKKHYGRYSTRPYYEGKDIRDCWRRW